MNFILPIFAVLILTSQTNCQSGEDISCGLNEWKCPTSRKCIFDFFRCDGYENDCPDNEDELDCEQWECLPGTWKCPQSFYCVPISWRCDGFMDCSFNEDETACEDYVCHSDKFIKCADNLQCISISDRCNGVGGDCIDQSDERGCHDCGHSLLLCDNNLGCVERAKICDGRKDCVDGSDELFCLADRNRTCSSSEVDTIEPDKQEPGDLEEVCPFGLKGSYCNETCSQCSQPLCTANAHETAIYEVHSLQDTCVPNDTMSLTLKGGQLAVFDSGVLGSIPIVFLKLSNVSIGEIDRSVFEGSFIRFLYLNHLMLTLSSAPSVNLQSLFVLNLDFNSLTGVPNLHGAHTLSVLSLNRNRITELSRRAFYDVRISIVSLYLSNNRINSINVNAFEGLSRLDILDLSNNCIQQLPIGLFLDLNNLFQLFLQNNGIYFFPLMTGVPSSGVAVWTSNDIGCSNFENDENWNCRIGNEFVVTARYFLMEGNSDDCDTAQCTQSHSCTNLIGGYKCDCTAPSCDFKGFIDPRCDSETTSIDGTPRVCSVNCDCTNTTLRCRETPLIATRPRDICLPLNLTQLDLDMVDLGGQENVAEVMERLPGLNSLILTNQNTSFLFEYLSTSFRPITEFEVVMSQLPAIPHSVIDLLNDLERLDLHGNEIEEVSTLVNTQLRFLDLSFNRITSITPDAFLLLVNLEHLDLSNNFMTSSALTMNPFRTLKNLQSFDISNNDVDNYPLDLFSNQRKLLTVEGDDFVICCLAEIASQSLLSCSPVDPIASCQRILGLSYMPGLIWVQVFFSLFGNISVFVLRVREYRKEVVWGRKLNTFLVGALSGADLCMAVFLVVVATADQVFKVDFYRVASDWRESVFCKTAGFLSFFSAEASMFTLLIITVSRMISVVKPLYYITINPTLFRAPVVIAWVAAFVMAVVPLFVFEDFYRSSSICLPTFYSSTSIDGWQFSLFVIILNCLAFVVMMTSYSVLVISTRRSKFDANKRHHRKNAQQGRLGRRVFVIVTTNFLCWVPICIMGFISLARGSLTFNDHIYPWTAVILLPINASMNPVIYTLLTDKNKLKKLFLRSSDARNTSLK